MIPEYKKILYATDLSKNSRFAFLTAAGIANRYDGKLIVFHVVEELSRSANRRMADILGREEWEKLRATNRAKAKNAIRERLDEFCEEVQQNFQGNPFVIDDVVIRYGDPVEEILFQTRTSDCDLVVIGTHGQGMVAGALLGGTAYRVVRLCKKPVMTIRLPEDEF